MKIGFVVVYLGSLRILEPTISILSSNYSVLVALQSDKVEQDYATAYAVAKFAIK
jgi:hypothetical protein